MNDAPTLARQLVAAAPAAIRNGSLSTGSRQQMAMTRSYQLRVSG